MRILIHLSEETADVHRMSDEVRKVLDVLNAAYIKTDGGGTIESYGIVTGVVVLRSADDAGKALEVLARAGIKASIA